MNFEIGSNLASSFVIIAALLAAVGIVQMSLGFYADQDKRIVEMVRAGADPIRSACAVSRQVDSTLCVAVVVKD